VSTKRLSQLGIVWALSVFCWGGASLRTAPILPALREAPIPVFFEELADKRAYVARGSNYLATVSANGMQWDPGPSEGRRPMRLQWIGSPENARLAAEEELAAKLHSFTGNDPSGWRTANIYKTIRAANVYPGIDILYHGTRGALEYDFVVAPRADPHAIRFRFDGPTDLRVEPNGNLLVRAGEMELVQSKPVAYQEYGRERRLVESQYILQQDEVVLGLGTYDNDRPLVIDPVVSYAASFAGMSRSGEKIVIDDDGNAFVMGTLDFRNPSELEVYDNKFGGGSLDVFVIKLNPAGTELVYATYFGGADAEFPTSLVIGEDGSAHVVGGTLSADFPTTKGALQATIGNGPQGSDAFATRLSADGSRLIYSTYLGGTGNDDADDAVLDADGNLVLAGIAGGGTFPTTPGSYLQIYDLRPDSDGQIPAALDGFIAKLDNTGSFLLFSTLVGNGQPWAIDVDPAGAIYVGGFATSRFEASNPNPSLQGNAFVAKFSKDGRHRLYATRFGGNGSSVISALTAGANGSLYLAGYTSSSAFGTTDRAFQKNFGGATFSNEYQNKRDGFIAKLNSDGDAFLYASYLGGNSQDRVSDLAIDQSGRAYLVGGTSSTNFPVTSDALQSVYRGGHVATEVGDAFYSVVNPTGEQLEYSTYIGGQFPDELDSVNLDLAGSIYVSGRFFGANPLSPTPGALQMRAGITTIAKLTSSAGPTPVIEELSPGTAPIDGNRFQLRVGGSGFASNAVLLWNRAPRQTIPLSSSQLEAIITSEDLSQIGPAEVRVVNPQQGLSLARLFDVLPKPGLNPRPRMKTVSPSSARAGSPRFLLAVHGAGFVQGAVVRWNGEARPTRFLSATSLEAEIPATDVSVTQAVKISVYQPEPEGGISNEADFFVAPPRNPAPGPTILSVLPSGAAAGSTARQIEITGSNFSPETVVRWNGVERPARLENRQFTMTVPAEDLAQAGMSEITLFDHTSGKTSNPLPFFTWLPMDAFDLAYDKVGDRVYGFVRNYDRTYDIVVIDPTQGKLLASIRTPNFYSSLAVSDNGRYFYASAASEYSRVLQRFEILNGAPWLGESVNLPVSVIAPMPGKADAFAGVVQDSFGKVTVSIYDGLTARPSSFTFKGLGANELEFVSPILLHVYFGSEYDSARTLIKLTVDGNGIAGSEQAPEAWILNSKPRTVNGLVVGSNGRVYSTTTFRQVGLLPASGMGPGVDGVLIVTLSDEGHSFCGMNGFDANTLLPLWVLRVPGGCNGNRSVVSMGNGRFVFSNSDKILFARQPSAVPLNALTTSHEALSTTVEEGEYPRRQVNIYQGASELPVSLIFQPQMPHTPGQGIRLESSTSATPGFVRLNLDPATPLGTFSGILHLLIGSAVAPVTTIPVQYKMIPSFPLRAEPASLRFEFRRERGYELPAPQFVRITKEGASLGVSRTVLQEGLQSPRWLDASYGEDLYTTPQNFRVSVQPAKLAPGTYRGSVVFSLSPGISEQRRPVTVPVTLEVR
jgi:hypothetical protein